jgi:sulfide:quinone oxidoreductase
VIVGGGSAGIATAASLLKRRRDLDVLIIGPQTKHYYQPCWTFVAAGVFRAAITERDKEGVIPPRALAQGRRRSVCRIWKLRE